MGIVFTKGTIPIFVPFFSFLGDLLLIYISIFEKKVDKRAML
jgi:hypothetical protein